MISISVLHPWRFFYKILRGAICIVPRGKLLGTAHPSVKDKPVHMLHNLLLYPHSPLVANEKLLKAYEA